MDVSPSSSACKAVLLQQSLVIVILYKDITRTAICFTPHPIWPKQIHVIKIRK